MVGNRPERGSNGEVLTGRAALILLQDAPEQTARARERLDLALLALALELKLMVVFIDDGVRQLMPGPDNADGLSLLKTIRQLELFDAEAIYAERESMEHFDITELDPVATPIDRQQLTALLHERELLL